MRSIRVAPPSATIAIATAPTTAIPSVDAEGGVKPSSRRLNFERRGSAASKPAINAPSSTNCSARPASSILGPIERGGVQRGSRDER